MNMLTAVGMLLAAAPGATAPPAQGATRWIDAADFETRGGWQLDTQFVYLMGSPCLLATGVQTPVEDATATFAVAEPGRYRIWARVRDWLPEYHPGRFQILIHDEPLPRVLGEADRDDWHWVAAGDVHLEAGDARMALHDLTGGFGRCAAVIVTRDMDYVPPHEVEACVQERARLRGIDITPRPMGRFDVVVVGGGPAGCPAAIAAARLGARTALIQDRPVLGGNASDELGVPMEGAGVSKRNARETGIVEEASRLRAQHGFPKMSEPFRILCENEPNLHVFLNTRMVGVIMADAEHISGVRTVDVLDGTCGIFDADYVVDCTGDGWAGYYAGARYRLGREAKWEFDEPDAPEQPDAITMSGCLMDGSSLGYRAEDMGAPAAYEPPPWAARLPDLATINRHPRNVVTGEWWVEHPGTRDDLYNAEQARDELVRITFGYWDYIKNVWAERKRAERLALTSVSYLNAKRETRRLMGDHVLTENDVLGNADFADTIAYAGWPLDIHNPQGIYGGQEGPFHTNHHYPGLCRIPFSCLYSVNVANLLFAGRCASVTHLALGTVRVERTLATLGQAAGTAAALCARYDIDPRTLRDEHLPELRQTLLKNDHYIPGLVNADPADLARTASVTASSCADYLSFSAEDVRPGRDYHRLDHRRAFMMPVMHGGRVRTASLLLRSEQDAPVTARLHLRAAPDSGDFGSTDDVAVAVAQVPPGGEHWVSFTFDRDVAAPYAWVVLDPVEGVSWRLMDTGCVGACRAYAGPGADGPDAWVPHNQFYACYFDPPAALQVDCSPANVVNGVSRIVDGATNMWRSAPDAGPPHWLELAFPDTVSINTVQITFGTDLDSRRLTKVRDRQRGENVLPGASDYTITGFDGAAWHTLVREDGNFQRWRRHRFEPVAVSRLRLTITSVAAMASAEVYEIRAYNE
ncbi:MAG: FAD-dependent oxidoreductase [Candidatus Hydrogenedentes bacterium]|nr:FAD-dependent oxidoreductase [Candidatus Hydrogenedentota bacterium]